MSEKVLDKIIRISGETYRNLQKNKIRKHECMDNIITRLLREQGFTENLLSKKFSETKTINKFAEAITDRLKEDYKFKKKSAVEKEACR